MKKKHHTREVAVYMENIHSTSPGVRVYMDNDPEARIIEPAKGQTSGRKGNEDKHQPQQGKGVRKSGHEEKISPRIDRRDCESAVVLRSASGPDSLLIPRPPHQRGNALGNENEVSRSQVISSQSFPVTMSRGEKYVFSSFCSRCLCLCRPSRTLHARLWEECSFNLLQLLVFSISFLIIASGKTETTFGPEGVFSSTSFAAGPNANHTPVTTGARPKRYILSSSPNKRSPSKALASGASPLLQDVDEEETPSGPGPSGGVVIYYSPTTDPATAASIDSSPNASPKSASSSSSQAAVAGDSGAGSSSSTPSKAGSRNNNDLIISSCSQFVDYEISV